MTPAEKALRAKIAEEILKVVKKIEDDTTVEFCNGMRLAAAIAEERRGKK